MPYSVKDAKDSFSEVIRLAESGQPQIIIRNEKAVAAVVSIRDWHRSQGKSKTLVEVLRTSPLVGLDLDLSRANDPVGETDLGE